MCDLVIKIRAGIQEAGVQPCLWGTWASFLTSILLFPIHSKEAKNTFPYLFRRGCGSDCLTQCVLDLSSAAV